MNETIETQSKLTLYSGLLVFLFAAVAALAYFSFNLWALLQQLTALPPSITVNKGAFYLLGVAIVLFALVFIMAYESVFKITLTDKVTSRFTKTAFTGLLLMIGLPHLIHYGVNTSLVAKQYSVCKEASHQWLHSRTIVYVNDAADCAKLSNKAE